MHAAVCTQCKYSSKLNLSCLFYPFCSCSISPSLSTDPASTIIICPFILLSTSSVVTVPQTSSSPFVLLLTGSGSGGRTSSSCWPPLTTRGAELKTGALFVDWEAVRGLDSSILESRGIGHSSGGDNLSFSSTTRVIKLQSVPYTLQFSPPQAEQAVTIGECCSSYLLSVTQVYKLSVSLAPIARMLSGVLCLSLILLGEVCRWTVDALTINNN